MGSNSKLAENKPHELVRSSIIRARFLELVGNELHQDDSEMFLLGLFSFIDAMLDQKMDDIVDKLPVSKNISSSLVDRTGDLFKFVRLAETYETGNWIGFKYAQKSSGLESKKIVEFYLEALAWADLFE